GLQGAGARHLPARSGPAAQPGPRRPAAALAGRRHPAAAAVLGGAAARGAPGRRAVTDRRGPCRRDRGGTAPVVWAQRACQAGGTPQTSVPPREAVTAGLAAQSVLSPRL